jgi:hypothetical protein
VTVNIYVFDFSRITAPILTKLGTTYPWGRKFEFVETKRNALLEGEIIAKY